MTKVVKAECASYEADVVYDAVKAAIDPLGGFSFLKGGETVAVKTNLISAMKPETAAPTHPAVICAVVRLLKEAGAGRVIVGDSPGGLYNAAAVNHAYRMAGLEAVREVGGELNDDFSTVEIESSAALEAKRFTGTAFLQKADFIIDVCKCKTHGMMVFTGAVKNFFGSIPGTMKPEYHFRYPNADRFADMLIDLAEHWKPALSICDAVEVMEGNGPTAGRPRFAGVILASASPHALDLAAARMMGFADDEIPTLRRAKARGFLDEIEIAGSRADLVLENVQRADGKINLTFGNDSAAGRLVSGTLSRALETRPKLVPAECIGCGKCASVCPAHAITMKNGKPAIDRKKCIRCFCCQEFCPRGAMRAHRTVISRILTH